LKALGKYLLGLAMLVLVLAALVWFLPVRWVMPWIAPRLHDVRLQQLSGSVWDGRAGQVVKADGKMLGSLHWQLSHRALFGQLRGQLEFHGALGDFSGALQRLPHDRLEWHDVTARLDLSALPQQELPSFGSPRGQVQLDVVHALLQGGWPMQLDGHLTWQQAAIRSAAGDVALGNLAADLQAQNGIVHVQWHDDATGPLQTTGQMQLSTLGWRLDANMRARQPDPRLQHWLAQWGAPDADGNIHVQRGGGLAGSITASPRDDTSP
jgi:general secretion pathway protein N